FQAEDGIRDFHVTGVQTCALPILLVHRFDVRVVLALVIVTIFFAGLRGLLSQRIVLEETTKQPLATGPLVGMGFLVGVGSALTRSEERRVGKEGRGRWGACG